MAYRLLGFRGRVQGITLVAQPPGLPQFSSSNLARVSCASSVACSPIAAFRLYGDSKRKDTGGQRRLDGKDMGDKTSGEVGSIKACYEPGPFRCDLHFTVEC